MNKFINLRNGRTIVTSYRYNDYQLTTLDDLINCAVEGTEDCLTADFTTGELCKHPRACEFLNQHAVACGSRRGGTVMVLDWDAFIIINGDTVVEDIA